MFLFCERDCQLFHLLFGFVASDRCRAGEPLDERFDAIADVIIKVGNIMSEMNEINEMELNPLIVYPEGSMAVDARIVLDTEVRSQKSEVRK